MLHVHPSCVKYVPEPEDTELLKCAVEIFLKFDCYPEALNLAIALNDMDMIKDIFRKSSDRLDFIDLIDHLL